MALSQGSWQGQHQGQIERGFSFEADSGADRVALPGAKAERDASRRCLPKPSSLMGTETFPLVSKCFGSRPSRGKVNRFRISGLGWGVFELRDGYRYFVAAHSLVISFSFL